MPSNAPSEPLALSKRQAAAQLGISERSLHDLLRSGAIPHVRVGRRVLIARTALLAWLDRANLVAPNDPSVYFLTTMFRAHTGDEAAARRGIAELENRTGWARTPAMLAGMYTALGDLETAFRYADEMIDQRAGCVLWLLSPSYARLQQDPRFARLLRRMNLSGKALAGAV